MNVNLTVEEITALAGADQKDLSSAIAYFENTLPYYTDEETDLKDFTNTLIVKLKAMSDSQYNGLNYSLSLIE